MGLAILSTVSRLTPQDVCSVVSDGLHSFAGPGIKDQEFSFTGVT